MKYSEINAEVNRLEKEIEKLTKKSNEFRSIRSSKLHEILALHLADIAISTANEFNGRMININYEEGCGDIPYVYFRIAIGEIKVTVRPLKVGENFATLVMRNSDVTNKNKTLHKNIVKFVSNKIDELMEGEMQ